MNYKNINDYEQLYLISEQDDEATSIIYEKYKPIVYSLAYKNLKLISNYGVDIDELVQEGFIGLTKAISSYNNNMSVMFYTFATLCIERQMKTFCKKFYTKKQKALNNKISIDIDADSFSNYFIELKEDENSNKNPMAYLENSYYNELCVNFKHSLSNRNSLIFELRCNGFKNVEICNLLDISMSIVERSIQEIKKKLVIYLNK